jgi:hypothetical protein
MTLAAVGGEERMCSLRTFVASPIGAGFDIEES